MTQTDAIPERKITNAEYGKEMCLVEKVGGSNIKQENSLAVLVTKHIESGTAGKKEREHCQ